MRSTTRVLVIVAAIVAPLASSVAQEGRDGREGSSGIASGSVLHVAPYAGFMVFGNYLNGPLGTTLTNKPGMLYGTQVGLSLSPSLQLVGNVGYTSSSIDVGLPIIGGVSVGHSSTLIYDADLEYSLGNMRGGAAALSPFVQAGVGAMQYSITAIDILTTNATNLAGNIGLGADVSLGRGMGLRLLAKDYIGKFNFKDATGLGVDGPTAHNFGFTAGLRFDF